MAPPRGVDPKVLGKYSTSNMLCRKMLRPLNPKHHLSPALSPISWWRGRWSAAVCLDASQNVDVSTECIQHPMKAESKTRAEVRRGKTSLRVPLRSRRLCVKPVVSSLMLCFDFCSCRVWRPALRGSFQIRTFIPPFRDLFRRGDMAC